MNRNRTQGTYEKNEAKNATDFIHPVSLMEAKEAHTNIFKAIDLLPEEQKLVFIKAYIKGLPDQEISKISNSSIYFIESLLHQQRIN